MSILAKARPLARLYPQFTRKLSSSSSAPLVTMTHDDSDVATITMDNKPVNALNTNFMRQLITAVQEAQHDSKSKAILLTSSADNIFSAGLDLQVYTITIYNAL